jgi:hypothetical protein
MLTITITGEELFNEETSEFLSLDKPRVLTLEHSLVSLSKWESKWEKPFLTKDPKTIEESIDYVQCMTLTQNVDPYLYLFLSNKNMQEVSEYIDKPMTATTFNHREKKTNSEIVTAELIYYWMIAYNIPLDCQKWHLNRLLTLINVCNIKNQPKKKMTVEEIRARNRALNEERRKKFNTTG